MQSSTRWDIKESTKEGIDWTESQIDYFNRAQISFTGKDEANVKGAKLAHLHTFDFNNAKDFYLKHGYEIFGTLDNCPTGYKHYYFKKSFGGQL